MKTTKHKLTGTFEEFLKLNPCKDGLDFVQITCKGNMKLAWRTCNNSQWMLWYLRAIKWDNKQDFADLARLFADRVKHLNTADAADAAYDAYDAAAYAAYDAAAYAAAADAAADAAVAAAHATHAAAYDAAYAAYAAAYDAAAAAERRWQANTIRKHFTF